MYHDIDSLECALRVLMYGEIEHGLPVGLTPEFSVCLPVRERQKRWAFQCLASKGEEFEKVLVENISSNKDAYKFLCCSNDTELLADMISQSVVHVIMQDDQDKITDEEIIGRWIGIYIRYVLLNNPWYVAADYNILFIRSWFCYFEKLESELRYLGIQE